MHWRDSRRHDDNAWTYADFSRLHEGAQCNAVRPAAAGREDAGADILDLRWIATQNRLPIADNRVAKRDCIHTLR